MYPTSHPAEEIFIEGYQLGFDRVVDLAGIRDDLLDVGDEILTGNTQMRFYEASNQLSMNEHRAVFVLEQEIIIHNWKQRRVLYVKLGCSIKMIYLGSYEF